MFYLPRFCVQILNLLKNQVKPSETELVIFPDFEQLSILGARMGILNFPVQIQNLLKKWT